MGQLITKQRCPKCGGNLFLYNDFDGWYEQCLQCSFTKYLDVIAENKAKVGEEVTTEKTPATLSAK